MTTKFFEIKGEKVKRLTRKAVLAEIGEARFKRIMAEAHETFFEDPYISIEYSLAGGRRLAIRFEAA